MRMIKNVFVPETMLASVASLQKAQSRFPVVARMRRYNGKTRPVPAEAKYMGVKCGIPTWETDTDVYSISAPYKAGELVYVGESVKRICITRTMWVEGTPVSSEDFFGWKYKSDNSIKFDDDVNLVEDEFHTLDYTEEKRWRSALTMPIEAARRYLRVVRVEVERLQEISPADIAREGIIDRHEFAYMRFKNYWNKKFQHRAYNVKWETNPWVWKINFEIDKPCEQEK